MSKVVKSCKYVSTDAQIDLNLRFDDAINYYQIRTTFGEKTP